MSSSYRGRHYAGRHRITARRPRAHRTLASGFVLPTLAAAALVVTATGATVAESSAETTLDVTAQEAAAARSDQAAHEAADSDLATRRQASAMQSAAVQGRVEATQRAARSAARKAAARAAAKAAARAKAEREGKRWVKAIRAGRQTSDFGPRWGKTHDGLDIGAATGTPLYAMSRGTVTRSFVDSSFGNKIEIRYWDGSVSWYAHMSARLVQAGDAVMSGDVVGRVGNTGYSFGSHLHIEIHPGPGVDSPMNPAPWLRNRGIMVG